MNSDVTLISHKTNQYFNRELSWLNFNNRVLKEAQSPDTPLLEKMKFIAIAYNNLDEFFMVRVAGKKRAAKEHISTSDSPDSTPYQEILARIKHSASLLLHEIYETYYSILAELKSFNVHIQSYSDLSKAEQSQLEAYFYSSIHPVLTPLAVDPAHPFPFLTNLRQYLLVEFRTGKASFQDNPAIAFVEIPHVLNRIVNIADSRFILLEDIIAQHIESLFTGFEIKDIRHVRVTRDLDITLLENDVVDLLQSVQNQVKARDQAEAVRLEISHNLPEELLSFLLRSIDIDKNDVYHAPGPLCLMDLTALCKLPLDTLKFEPFNPRIPSQFRKNTNIFSLIRESDILLHHPFESFYTVIEFIRMAARDPKVLAIKQTLYRTSGDSPIIDALIEATESGKQVTAVVELKARFDEKNNIIWARRLERSGVNVVYGFIGLKTHCKATLVVRQENNSIGRYCHLSTGNYNSSTAKLYTDIGLITADSDFGQDMTDLFNLLTGFNVFTAEQVYREPYQPKFRVIYAAPLELRDQILKLLDQEIEHVQDGKVGLFIGKFNALVDKPIIDKLYEASSAGVKIQLMVRGICCLKPSIQGLSENIEVRSLVDRFLEHSRIYYFHNDGDAKAYLSSADLMPRNMDRRIEILFPIKDEKIKDRILNEILSTYWQDNTKARVLLPDGSYKPIESEPHQKRLSAQQRLIEIAREQGIKSLPYEKAIWHNPKERGRPIAKWESKSVLNVKGTKK